MAKKDNSALAWLIGLGTLTVAGVGIYFYEKSQPPAPQTAPGAAGGTDVGARTIILPGQTAPITYAQVAQFAASVDHADLATWQQNGIPADLWAQMSPAIQGVMTALGYTHG